MAVREIKSKNSFGVVESQGLKITDWRKNPSKKLI